jgi:HK97 family phage portal protein
MLLTTSGSMSAGYSSGLADSTPIPNPAWNYPAPDGISLIGRYAQYAAIYRSQVWVYVLVNKIAAATARLPYKVFELDGTARIERPDTSLAALMAKPNPKLSRKFLWLWTSATLELYGEAMWVKLRDDRDRVLGLYPIHPTNMQLQRLTDGTILYHYNASGGSWSASLATFVERDVVHFRKFNPDGLERGVSPCEPLRQSLINEDASRRASEAMWRNGARPAVILTRPDKPGRKPLSVEGKERLADSFDAANAGVENRGGTAVLEEGITPHVVQLNAEEMQYIESRRLHQYECCATWDVPPPVVHILDRSTFNNITELMRSMYRDTMAPKLDTIQDVVQDQLITPDFDPSGQLQGTFDLSEVLAGSPEQMIAANAQAIGTAQMQPAEARAKLGLPYLAGSERLLVNAALIPLETASASPATGTDVVASPQHVKRLEPDDERRVMGRLSRASSIDDIDVSSLVAGIDDPDDLVLAHVRAAQSRGDDVATLRRRLAGAALQEVSA